MMQALQIIASSWPIAVIVVGLVAGLVIWSLFRRGMKYSHESAMDYRIHERANRAVAIRRDDD